MFSERVFEVGKGIGESRVMGDDTVPWRVAVLGVGVNTPHPFNAIKGKKIALRAGKPSPLPAPLCAT